jgi:hypothetical protein
MNPDLYISADIETDGPIPGEYSMLSFALVLAGGMIGQSADNILARYDEFLLTTDCSESELVERFSDADRASTFRESAYQLGDAVSELIENLRGAKKFHRLIVV